MALLPEVSHLRSLLSSRHLGPVDHRMTCLLTWCNLLDREVSSTLHGLKGHSYAFVIVEVKRIVRPTDVPDTGLICDFLWADPDKDGSRMDF